MRPYPGQTYKMLGSRILVLSGEASGDLHASGLIRELLKRDPSLEISCVGGQRMKEAGASVIVPSSSLSVVGLFEVFSHLPPIASAFLKVKRWIRGKRPSLVVLVDFPEFNLMMGKYARKLGIPVFYYISPQVWAWRQGRVKKIRQIVNKMAVILPFEEDFFRGFGIDAVFVGHPLLDAINVDEIDAQAFKRDVGLGEKERLVCLLPGSRKGEVERHLPIMMGASYKMKKERPELRFCVALGPGTTSSIKDSLRKIIKQGKVDARLVEGRTYEAIKAAELCIAASGTVTLEAAVLGTPMVVTYKVSSLSYHLGKRLIKVDWVSLVNLIAKREVVPELLQLEATPKKIAETSLHILNNRQVSERMRSDFKKVVKRLGERGAARRTAGLVLELIRSSPRTSGP